MQPKFLVRLSAIVTFVFTAAAFAGNDDADAAVRDRASHFAPADWGYIYYITLRPHAGQAAKDLERAIRMVVASTSTQPVLERALPTKVATGLYRIDLRDLNWNYEDWVTVNQRNPYALGQVPLIVRADWLLVELSDQRESDSGNRLLFGGKNIPKTRDDILKFFKVVNDPALTFGWIEGNSSVSKQLVRLASFLPIARGFASITSDVLKLSTEQDPLEHPDGNFKFDGQEGIIWQFKMSSASGEQGVLPYYWLNDGKGNVIAKANVDLVEDTTHFRGFAEIAPPGSCIQCHINGANNPTKNEFRDLLKSGVKVFANDRKRAELEAFHLLKLDKQISRINEDFGVMVTTATGVSPAESVASFKAAINRYDAPLYLTDAADELGVDAKLLSRVLATNADLPARLASLPHGEKTDKVDTRGRVPRASWEENYEKVYYATFGGQPVKRPPVEEPKIRQAQEQKATDKAAPQTSGNRR